MTFVEKDRFAGLKTLGEDLLAHENAMRDWMEVGVGREVRWR